jgi:hypothetical protein
MAGFMMHALPADSADGVLRNVWGQRFIKIEDSCSVLSVPAFPTLR